jgi:hypothetical protein
MVASTGSQTTACTINHRFNATTRGMGPR